MKQEGAGSATVLHRDKIPSVTSHAAWLGAGRGEAGRRSSEGKLKELRAALVCIGGRCVAGQMCGGELQVCRDVGGLWAN